MNVGQVCRVLEDIAPPSLAAEWDNVGLLIGSRDHRVRRLMLCIDLTAEVLEEARRNKADMVMAYHPVIFHGLKRLTDADAPVALEAARTALAVYSMHTALDAATGGTNDVLAEMLKLRDVEPLEPYTGGGRCKVVTFLPESDLSAVSRAVWDAGAGVIGEYEHCSFRLRGEGTFRGGEASRPTVGRAGRDERVEEVRLETICSTGRMAEVAEAIRRSHSYEEPPIDVYPLEALPEGTGMGRIGSLPGPVKLPALLRRVKEGLGISGVWLACPAAAKRRSIRRVAVGAGSCGSLWKRAVAGGADAFLTGEMRHHDALAARAAGLSVICTGHSNSERIALKRLAERLRRELPKLEVRLSRIDRDPFEIG